MKEVLLEIVKKRKVHSKIKYYITTVREAIKKQTITEQLNLLKERAKKVIYSKSYQLKETSVRDIIKQTARNTKKSAIFASKLSLRNIKQSKYRSFLLIIGITLTIALETGIVVSIDTLYDNFIFDNRNRNYTDITVNPKSWTDLPELKSLAKRINGISGVSKASPVYYATANDFAGQQISQNIILYGIDSKSHPDFSKLNVTEGHRRVSGSTIMISQSLKNGAGVEVGDTVDTPSSYGLQSTSITIGGILSDDSLFGNKYGYLFILIDIETLFENIIEEYKENYLKSEIDISVSDFLDIETIGERLKDELGLNYFVFIEKEISIIEASGIKAYQTAMNLVVISSFVVEFLFITNILAIAIRDRSREIGVLRAIGTSNKQLIETITMEILIYSIIGGFLGIFLGICSSYVLVSIIDNFYSGLTIHSLILRNSSLTAAFLSGIIVALISGLYPIFLCLKMPIIQNIHNRMRSNTSSHTSTNFWKYTIASGVLLSITGFVLQYFVGPSRFLNFEILSFHFLIIITIFLGTLLLEVGILVFLPNIAYKTLFWFGIISRTISTRNIVREFQKSLFTIITSALALAFIIIVGLVSVAVIRAVPVYFEDQWGSIDLLLEASDTELVPISVSNRLDSESEVIKSCYIQEFRTKLNQIDAYVYGVDPVRYRDFSEPIIESIDPSRSSYLFLDQDDTNHSTSGTQCLISRILYQKLDIPIGSNISVAITDNSTVDIKIAAIIKTNIFLGNGEYIYISSSRFLEFYNTSLAKYFLCDVTGSRESAQKTFESKYQGTFKNIITVDFFTRAIDKSLKFQSAIFQVLFIESFILAAIAQFVCILVSTLHMEREMGVMRALGLHKRGVFGIFMSEAMTLGLTAVIIGLFDGLLGTLLLSWYIKRSLPIEFKFPIERITFWLIFSFLITISSTYLPSYRSSKKNIVATISGRPFSKSYTDNEALIAFSYQTEHLQKTNNHSYLPELFSNKTSFIKNSKFSEINNIELDSNERHSTIIQSIKFIFSRKIQFLTVFLILLAFITFNYIIDVYIIIRGFISFDLVFYILFSNNITYMASNYIFIPNNILFPNYINPFLFFIGLALLGPISYYLYYKHSFSNLIVESIKGLIIGIIVMGCTIILSVIEMLVINFLEDIFSEVNNNPEYMIYIMLPMMILSTIIIILFCQKAWVFLVYNALNPNLSLNHKIKYSLKSGSKNLSGFFILLLTHFVLQTYLLYLLFINSMNYLEYQDRVIFKELDPISFLILSTFEIGYFLLLIAFQSVQFKSPIIPLNKESPKFVNETDDIKKLKENVSFTADKLLKENDGGINMKLSGCIIFSKSIKGNFILFFQENSNSMPIAMNYARDWPQSTTKINNFSNIEIKVPTLEQMNLFIDITKDLITNST